jgi:hypothetical protein
MTQMPMGRFLVGVFVAPVALGLLFTPVFLLDMGGLSFNGRTLAETSLAEGPAMAAKHRCTVLLNVFLYAYVLNSLIQNTFQVIHDTLLQYRFPSNAVSLSHFV